MTVRGGSEEEDKLIKCSIQIVCNHSLQLTAGMQSHSHTSVLPAGLGGGEEA